MGQVVLLSGEAALANRAWCKREGSGGHRALWAWLTPCQCSPYYQHSALYPMIELLSGGAALRARGVPAAEAQQTGGFLVQYGLPLAETVPLFAALLSLPLGADYAPLDCVPRAAEAADRTPPRDPAAHCGPATSPL